MNELIIWTCEWVPEEPRADQGAHSEAGDAARK
jgi:hypothetical protein